MSRSIRNIGVATLCAAFLMPTTIYGSAIRQVESDRAPDLYRAYFLEHHSKDFAAAKAIYDTLLRDGLSVDATSVAQAGSARCRDQLVARNFAAVMPPETVAYLECRRPGEIARELAGMLGLTDRPIVEALSDRPDAQCSLPFYVPNEIIISPAILDVLGAFGGIAVAATEIDVQNHKLPAMVAVIHHGDVTLLKGLLETAFQFSPPTTKVRDLPTFGAQIPHVGQITGVLTESLLIIGTNRALVEGVIGRIMGEESASLESEGAMRDCAAARKHATLFAFADLKQIMTILRPQFERRDRGDFARVNTIADLDNLDWVTISVGVDGKVLNSQLTLRLTDSHHSFLFNLLKLTPLTKRCLSMVPADAAAIFGCGLNPAIAQTPEAVPDTTTAVSGLDVGREFFGNIQEICGFVVPGAMGQIGEGRRATPLPNFGAVVTVNDVRKSRALWNELLRLPGLLGGKELIEPTAETIDGLDVTVYEIPEIGKVYMGELEQSIVLGLTRNAIRAIALVRESGRSILDDAQMRHVLNDLPQDTSLMLVVHFGRVASAATAANTMQVALAAGPLSQICRESIAWATVSQSPNQLTLRFSLAGLPNINDTLRQFRPLIQSAMGTFEPRSDRRDVHAVAIPQPAPPPPPEAPREVE